MKNIHTNNTLPKNKKNNYTMNPTNMISSAQARIKWSRHSKVSSDETKNQRISLTEFNKSCNNIFKLELTLFLTEKSNLTELKKDKQ